MPSNYNETAVTGTKWRRAYKIELTNELNQTPSILYRREEVIELPDNTIKTEIEPFTKAYDPNEVIAIVDPVTLIPTGDTVTLATVYQCIFSTFIQHDQANG